MYMVQDVNNRDIGSSVCYDGRQLTKSQGPRQF